LEQERYMPVPSSKLRMIDGLNYNRVWIVCKNIPQLWEYVVNSKWPGIRLWPICAL
jgi:hypothetical protein